MANLLARFERVYVINLPSRVDRRREMSAQLARIGLSLTSPEVCLFEALRPTDAGGFPSIGTRGCFLSHLGVLRDAVARGLQRILILEDDLNFSDDFTARAPAALTHAFDTGFAVFYGGHEGGPPLEPIGHGLVELPAHIPVQTAHFIGFQGPVIAELAEWLGAMVEREPGDPEGGPMHVDGAYCWFRRVRPDLRTLAAVPKLGHQRASRTDIHDLQWFDKTPVVRQIVARLRHARNG